MQDLKNIILVLEIHNRMIELKFGLYFYIKVDLSMMKNLSNFENKFTFNIFKVTLKDWS